MAGRTRSRSNPQSSSRPVPLGRALVASSARYTGADAPRVYGVDKGWQRECYRYYSIIGEARYAAQYYGNALSKCELFMSEPVLLGEGAAQRRSLRPAFGSVEQAHLDDVFSGRANQSQMLHDIGVHLTVGGECFVVGRYQGAPVGADGSLGFVGDGGMIWEVVSPVDMNVHGKGWQLEFEGYAPVRLTDNDVVIRIWRPDPFRRLQADSPFKSLLPVLKEIENLDLHIYTQLISRIAANGIWAVPEEMDLPEDGTGEDDDTEAGTANAPSRLMTLLAEAGKKAIANPGSPAARIPLILQVPGEFIDKLGKPITFWSELDAKAIEMRSNALHRFASGMDLPNEMIEGMSSNEGTGGGRSNGVSHWGAWQIEESAIKIHIEPMLELIASAFTVDYIRHQVPGTALIVTASTEKLRLRPDRSEQAFELHDRFAIGYATLLKENGFDPSDAPNDAEVKRMILLKIATGSATPEMVAAANALLDIDLPMPEPPAQPAAEMPQTRPTPSLVDHPTRPRDPSESAAALEVACHGMVLTALSRVGNRLIQRKVQPPEGVPTYATHTFALGDVDTTRLLDGAFPMANEMLEGIGDPAEIVPVLQRYTAALIATKAEHDRSEMMKWLERTEVPA